MVRGIAWGSVGTLGSRGRSRHRFDLRLTEPSPSSARDLEASPTGHIRLSRDRLRRRRRRIPTEGVPGVPDLATAEANSRWNSCRSAEVCSISRAALPPGCSATEEADSGWNSRLFGGCLCSIYRAAWPGLAAVRRRDIAPRRRREEAADRFGRGRIERVQEAALDQFGRREFLS
jgi:hypothetical protein